MNLKSKLITTLCGPLAILVIVGLMSVRTVSESSKAIDRIFRENYDSAAACFNMKGALERLDRIAELSLWKSDVRSNRDDESAIKEFERNLAFQQGNVTIPGEQEITDHLAALWKAYRGEHDRFMELSTSSEVRRQHYLGSLLPHSQEIKNAVQRIIDLNLENMSSADGQARQRAVETTTRMSALVVAGVVLMVLFMGVIGPSVVNPITRLTQSVREIQQGNLDLMVKVHSKDEVGELAKAFNEMAASLRQFRRTGRARLLRTQRATQLALDTFSDAVAICSPNGEIELSNDAARRLFDLKPESTIGAAGNEEINRLFTRARQELRPIKPKGYEGAIQIFQDGEECFYFPEAVPILDDDQHLIGIAVVLSDITGTRRCDEIRGGLISTVSHELKTPLTSIRLATHALLSEKLGPLSPKQVELLVAARDDSDRLYRIIEKLLDIGKMQSGRDSLDLRPVDAQQLVVQTVEEMRSAFVDRGVGIGIHQPGDIPPVLVDPVLIDSVFRNLLSNALKYTAPGGQVTVSARQDEHMVRFSVQDTGSGIPKEYLPHIFEKFFRVPGQEQQRDSGLGLAIVKEIIEAHGGKIDVASKPGEGTRFEFTLKAVSSEE